MPSLVSSTIRIRPTVDSGDETRLRSSASRWVLAGLLGAGALSAAVPAKAANFDVANESQLRTAMTARQRGGRLLRCRTDQRWAAHPV